MDNDSGTTSEAFENLEAIAIIGMAGRFPGAANLEQFWQNLRDGVESIQVFSDQELEAAGVDGKVFSQPNYVKAGGALAGIEWFDAAFFGLSPREAEVIDPQQRIFLEVAWSALESAGYDPQAYSGSVGVYAGSSVNTYFLNNLYPNRELSRIVGADALRIASRSDNLATRTAYKLNLRGPSVSLQTGCSTSLVAVHMACQSLLSGECDMVLAGGVSISSSAQVGYSYHEGGFLSPDGHCRAFDAQAQGTINGNGVGLVVLKQLPEAIAAGDAIQAVIKGSAVNNDGAAKVGYTAPSVTGQAAVIAEALAVAEVEPETIDYIEAHGTGTSLGDPIEIAALNQVFRGSKPQGICAIGSVKTNIGHLDTAAGIAGLIKTVLALQHRQIPPSLHFHQPNPGIDFAASPFSVNASLSEWPTHETSRRAGVSSFGIGGTNAHVVLEEAPAALAAAPDRVWQLLVVSAKTSTALEQATANLADYLIQNPNLNLADVAYTLQLGRRSFEHRRMVVCRDLDDAVAALKSSKSQRCGHSSGSDRLVFLFPGQGSQYPKMGWELYQVEPYFRQQVDYCCDQLTPLLALDLRTVMFPQTGSEAAVAMLEQTALAQPALFVIEYALAQLWMNCGVQPATLIGHSIGEYVAACLAGVFSLEDALALVAARGKLMQQLPPGAMLSVALPESEVKELLGENLSLAVSNGPSLCVASGPVAAVAELEQKLGQRGIPCRLLHTSHAFHSPLVSAILEPFTAHVRATKLNPPNLPLVSNVTGTWMQAEEATDPAYWGTHLLQTVRFSQGIKTLLGHPNQIFLEVGPGRTLSTLVRQHDIAASVVLPSLRHPQESQSDVAFLLHTLGQLWLHGVPVNWAGYAASGRRRVPLPTYPFEQARYWIDSQSPVSSSGQDPQNHKRPDMADWFYVPVWQQSPRVAEARLKTPQRWLIFADDELGSQLAQRLAQADQQVITVSAGAGFAQLGERAYVINPQQQSDYTALLQTLDRHSQQPSAIAHLWSLLPQAASAEAGLAEGFYSLLFLTQSLSQRPPDPLALFVVTRNLHDITGEELLQPEQAMILGACKVIAQEHPHIACRRIDVGVSHPTEQQLVEQLVSEFSHPADAELLQPVAYRGPHRWVQIFQPLRLPASAPSALKERGVYLITGGLGGIGLALAEHLACSVQAKLILVGRSGLPPKAAWQEWLAAHDSQEQTSSKILKVQALESLGAEVMVARADVASLKQMQAVQTEAWQRFGSIHGVIHAAGVAGGGMIQFKTPAVAKSVLTAKVEGTLVLETLFQDLPLDFFVLCSSLSSIVGGVGQVDYCAANAFLDGFAHRNNRSGLRAIAINWCAWQQVGMAVETAVPEAIKQQRQTSLEDGILPSEGAEAFCRILTSGLSQVIVSTQDLKARIAHSASLKVEQELAKPSHSRPQLSHTYVAPRTEVEQRLADIWQQLLGVGPIGVHDNFFELGGHSLLATQVMAQLRQFQLPLPLRALFDHQTIAELAAVIEEMLLQEIETLTEAEAQHLLHE